jgi:peptidoglycan hydrolase-like protein with peptidoglycan-binding domain
MPLPRDQAPPKRHGKTAPPAAGGQANVTGIQKLLQRLGYDPGKIDGIMGPNTKEAIKKFQKASGLPADGNLNPTTQAALAKAGKGGAGAADGAAAGGAAPGGADGAGATGAPTAPQVQQPALDASSKDAGTLDYGFWVNARKNAIDDLKALAAKIAGAAKTAGTKPADAGGVLKEINAIIGMLPPKPAPQEIDKLAAIIRQDDAITAAEECPKHFHEVNIRKPLLEALDGLRK